MALQTAPAKDCTSVIVALVDIHSRETFPNRIVRLLPPNYEIRIGRGSQTEQHLHPCPSNTWFSSRVMSREHAILRADPTSKQITLEDRGSMHGTYIEGVRLEPDKHVPLRERELIQFGAEIVRGDQTYKPLELMLEVDWNDDYMQKSPRTGSTWLMTSKNSFSFDYSDEEDDNEDEEDYGEEEDDDDIELVYESLKIPQSVSNHQSRTFSVPDSDSSVSEIGNPAEESTPTCPVGSADTSSQNIPSSLTIHIDDSEKDAQTLPGSSLQTALNVSDDEEAEPDKENETPEVIDCASDNGISDNDYDEDHDLKCSDEDDDEDYDQQNDINEALPMASSLGEKQVEKETHLRAPSPSDAAMPKPSFYQSSNLPTIQNLVDQGPPPPVLFNNSFSATPVTASHYPQFAYFPDMGWVNNDTNASFAVPCDLEYEAPSYQQQPDIRSTSTQYTVPLTSQTTANLGHSPTAATLPIEETTLKPSKVSINDIIDDVKPDSATFDTSRKRKADELSMSDSMQHLHQVNNIQTSVIQNIQSESTAKVLSELDTDSTACNQNALQDEADTVPERSPSHKKTVTFSPDTVIIDSELQRPTKRAKLASDNQGSAVFKYVATALAGATLGAVGTIVGLAALPADYFI